MKVHLQQCKGFGAPACGKSFKHGQNKGITFGYPPKIFREHKDEECCATCKQIYLARRNLNRHKKGMPPVTVWNEGGLT